MEAALLMPLMVIVSFGAVDVAQYINSGQVISNCSREGARVASKTTTGTVQEVEDAITSYLNNILPQLSETELDSALTVQVREIVQTTTTVDEEEVTTTTYNQIPNGDLSSVDSGDAISILIQFDYSAIRWLQGPGFSEQEIETVCRRQ